jgi:aspartate carbamoyltransferase
MYENPCRIFGLKPTPAEISIRSEYTWTFDVSDAKSRCGWSPFEGKEMRGKVVGLTFADQTLMTDGQLKDAGPLSSWMDDAPVFKDYPSSFDATSGCEPAVSTKKEMTRESVICEPPVVVDRHIRTTNPLSLRPFGITSVLTAKAFDKPTLRALFDRATHLRAMDLKGTLPQTLTGKALTLLFMEPSTRTSLSFQRAATKMGASVMIVQPSTSSLIKGESLSDTLRCLAISSDGIVLRGPTGCVEEAKPLVEDGTLKCLISGGDGTKEHPTQALLDVYTIREELGSLHGLTITLVGDMRHGRTIPSLLHLLCLYRVKQVYCVAPDNLNLSEEFVETLQSRGLPLALTSNLEDVLPNSDVVYMTRLQKERMGSFNLASIPPTISKVVYSPYILDSALLAKAKREMIVMHPLPRNDEISTEVDSDPRAVYFRQMEYGLYLRMALLEGLMVS